MKVPGELGSACAPQDLRGAQQRCAPEGDAVGEVHLGEQLAAGCSCSSVVVLRKVTDRLQQQRVREPRAVAESTRRTDRRVRARDERRRVDTAILLEAMRQLRLRPYERAVQEEEL